MVAMKFPRRMPVRTRVEAVEREEYVDAPAPVNPVRRTFATMPAVPSVTLADDENDLPPYARPGYVEKPDTSGPVRIFTRKS